MIALSLNEVLVIIIIADFGTGVTERFYFSTTFFEDVHWQNGKKLLSALTTQLHWQPPCPFC